MAAVKCRVTQICHPEQQPERCRPWCNYETYWYRSIDWPAVCGKRATGLAFPRRQGDKLSSPFPELGFIDVRWLSTLFVEQAVEINAPALQRALLDDRL